MIFQVGFQLVFRIWKLLARELSKSKLKHIFLLQPIKDRWPFVRVQGAPLAYETVAVVFR